MRIAAVRARPIMFAFVRSSSVNADRAALGIEPRTSRTRSENHTTRPSSQLTVRGCVFGGRAAASTLCVASEAVAARTRESFVLR